MSIPHNTSSSISSKKASISHTWHQGYKPSLGGAPSVVALGHEQAVVPLTAGSHLSAPATMAARRRIAQTVPLLSGKRLLG